MISHEKRFYQSCAFLDFAGPVVMPAQAFLPYSAIEAFNIGLLILAIWPGNTVSVAKGWYCSEEISLEFRSAVGLDKVNMVIEASCHALVKEAQSVFSGKFRCQEDIRFPGDKCRWL